MVVVNQENEAPVLDFNLATPIRFAVAGGTEGPTSYFIDDGFGGYSIAEVGGLSASRGDVAIGDLNGDGLLDLFAARSYAADAAFLNDGTGTLVSSGQTLGDYGGFAVELVDIEGDGDLDAVVVNNYGGVRIWQNDGTGMFTDVAVLDGFRYRDVAIGDLDGDGELDLVAVRTQGYFSGAPVGEGGILFSFGQNGAAFTLETHAPSQLINMVGVELADFDGDGDLDIFAASTTAGNTPDAQHHMVLLNDGAGNFTTSAQILVTSSTQEIAAGDFDGDGDVDIAMVDGTNTLQLLLNDGLGGFVAASHTLNSVGFSITAQDVNGDGRSDLAVGSWTDMTVYEVQTAGLTTLFSVTTPSRVHGIDFGDLAPVEPVLSLAENDTSVFLDLSVFADDANIGDVASLTYEITGAPQDGSASITGTILTFDPGTDFQDLADGETQEVAIQITVTDQHGATATDDLTVTVNGTVNNVDGTQTDDVFTGSAQRDHILGLAGDDTLSGGGGNDILDGGAGDDIVSGGTGHDIISGGAGRDVLLGDAGADVIQLGGTTFFTSSYAAFNISSGLQVGTQVQVNLAGLRRIEAVIDGGTQADTVRLSDQGDAFFLHDAYSGFHNSVSLTADYIGRASTARFANIEEIRGMGGDDVIDLTSPDYSLAGVVMSIDGGDGNDVIWGSDANETILGGAGADTLFGGSGTDILTGGLGADVFEFTRTSTDNSVTDFNVGEGDTLRFYNTDGADFDASSVVLTGNGMTISYMDASTGTGHIIAVTLAPSIDEFTITLPELLSSIELI